MDFTEALASLQDPDPGVLVGVKTAVKWLDVINHEFLNTYISHE